MTTTELIMIAVLIGLVPGAIASSKGHSFVAWWLFGAALFIIALPGAMLLKPNRTVQRKCPHCAEWVAGEAKVCKHCHRDLPAMPAAGWYPVDGGYERYWDGLAWTNKGRRD